MYRVSKKFIFLNIVNYPKWRYYYSNVRALITVGYHWERYYDKNYVERLVKALGWKYKIVDFSDHPLFVI
jgi:hypothetical protein